MFYALLIKHVNLSIRTPGPSNDLVLTPLEHDNGGISESGAANGGIGVISDIIEAAKHYVVGDNIGQRIRVLSNATGDIVD